MRRIRSIFLFVIVLLLVDRAVGEALQELYFRTSSGEGGGQINRDVGKTADVLLLGSSRMKHHANPDTISNILGMSVYNAGVNGQDFLYAAMLFDLRRSNPMPRAVVINVDRRSFSKNDQELVNAKVFSYFINRSPVVHSILLEQNWVDRLKYLSSSYRANNKVLSIFSNLFSKSRSDDNGFVPLSGEMKVAVPDLQPAAPFWSLKVSLLESMAQTCRKSDTRLILVSGPRYLCDPGERTQYLHWRAQMDELLAKFPDVRFIEINEFTHPGMFSRSDYFRDSSHLNYRGAEVFSTLLGLSLKESFPQHATGSHSSK